MHFPGITIDFLIFPFCHSRTPRSPRKSVLWKVTCSGHEREPASGGSGTPRTWDVRGLDGTVWGFPVAQDAWHSYVLCHHCWKTGLQPGFFTVCLRKRSVCLECYWLAFKYHTWNLPK